jgi:hypothetical protein
VGGVHCRGLRQGDETPKKIAREEDRHEPVVLLGYMLSFVRSGRISSHNNKVGHAPRWTRKSSSGESHACRLSPGALEVSATASLTCFVVDYLTASVGSGVETRAKGVEILRSLPIEGRVSQVFGLYAKTFSRASKYIFALGNEEPTVGR